MAETNITGPLWGYEQRNRRLRGLWPSTITPFFTVTAAASSINEGSALTINVTGLNIPNGTYYWTIDTNAGDFGTSSGSFTVTSNAGSFTVTPTADNTTEGSETFTVSIRSGSTSGTILTTSTAITINDTSLTPTIIGYIADVAGSTSTSEVAYSVARDSSGNIYVSGASDISGTNSSIILKFNSTLTLQWKVQAAISGLSITMQKITTDSSGNVYSLGYDGNSGGIVYKFDSSGAIQWQRGFKGPSATNLNSISVDSSGNVYVAGNALSSLSGTFSNDGTLIKYNSSGTLQWQNIYYQSSPIVNEQFGGITLDSSGNIYMVGGQVSGSVFNFVTVKTDSSGAIVWQRSLSGSSVSHVGLAVAVDASGNVYSAGYSTESTYRSGFLAKYNSSGTLQWQKKLYFGSHGDWQAIRVDSSGNSYVVGSPSGGPIVVAKYNTSGTLQWQRRLTGTSGYGIELSSDELYVYVTGMWSPTGTSGSDVIVARLPTDGTKTGTYSLAGGSPIYATYSATDLTPTLTDSAGTFTSSTSNFTDSVATSTISTPSLSGSVVTI